MKSLLLVSIILLNLGLVSCDQNSACLDKDYNNRHAITTSKNNLNASSFINNSQDTQNKTLNLCGNKYWSSNKQFHSIILYDRMNHNKDHYDYKYQATLGYFNLTPYRRINLRNEIGIQFFEHIDTEGTPLKNDFLKWAEQTDHLDVLINAINTKKRTIQITNKNNKKENHFRYITTMWINDNDYDIELKNHYVDK